MRRRRVPAGPVLGVVLAAALFAATPGRAQGGSCAECCKLPCIEAQIWEAKYMKGFYQRLAAIPGLTQEEYERRELDAKQLSSVMSRLYLGTNPSCKWDTPDPRDPTAWRERFIGTGFSVREQGGIEEWDLTLKVDPETCALTHPRAAEVLPTITPCEGIGRATLAHEQKHIDDCLARRKRGGGPLTPAQNARDEVAGYEAELKVLAQLRLAAAAPCVKESCKTTQPQFDRASRLFETDIRLLLGIDKKPASKSPLARKPKGNGR
ncbi:MAG TPA: hypothetical protein PKM64_04545 [Thermoanaerobaculia bacterium]|nr:hypothetical protein [Thermoanaerobaculia bacterium]